MKNEEIEKITAIVEENTGRTAVFMPDKSHDENMACKMACCWGGLIRQDSYEIKCCQPSPAHKGDTPRAYFTFKKL
jgi:hypothetical protein